MNLYQFLLALNSTQWIYLILAFAGVGMCIDSIVKRITDAIITTRKPKSALQQAYDSSNVPEIITSDKPLIIKNGSTHQTWASQSSE